MKKDDLIYIQHMLAYAIKLRDYSLGLNREKYELDESVQAVYRYWLQVIGEAANHVSEDFQDHHPHIGWRRMIGMRNRIVHDYLGVDNDMVWDSVAKGHMQQLIVDLEELLASE